MKCDKLALRVVKSRVMVMWTDNPPSFQLPTDSQQKGIARRNLVNSGASYRHTRSVQDDRRTTAQIIKHANPLRASSEAAIREMYIAESLNLSHLAVPIGQALRSYESALTLVFLGVNPHKRKNNRLPTLVFICSLNHRELQTSNLS
jgi:hypothetical protein